MLVREYLQNNKEKAAYTIKKGKKQYLCTLFECWRFFGNEEIKNISFKYENENLPLITIL